MKRVSQNLVKKNGSSYRDSRCCNGGSFIRNRHFLNKGRAKSSIKGSLLMKTRSCSNSQLASASIYLNSHQHHPHTQRAIRHHASPQKVAVDRSQLAVLSKRRDERDGTFVQLSSFFLFCFLFLIHTYGQMDVPCICETFHLACQVNLLLSL